jgi:small GTP-binding protein
MSDISIKVVLVGESGIGKTCIIERFVNDHYDDKTESTMNAAYKNKTIEIGGQKLSLDIWDTAGQEMYRAVNQNFYLNATIGIMVYDITREETFEELKNYWHEQLKNSGDEDMVFGIAGNKCDLLSKEKVNEKTARAYAKEIGAVFFLTSCKENIGISNLFEECGKKYLEKNNLLKGGKKDKGLIISKDDFKGDQVKKKKKCC